MCVRSLTTQSPSNWSDSSPSSPPSLANGASLSQSPTALGAAAAHACTVGSIRKRVVRACEVCRRKKVKCNGQKPCSHCISFAEECIYVDVKDRSAYSRRYVESLELRLAKLEHAWSMMLQHPCHPQCRRALNPAQMDAPDGQTFETQQIWTTTSASAQIAVPSQCEMQSVSLSTLSAAHLIAQASASVQSLHPSTQFLAPRIRNKTKAETPHALTLLPLPEGAKFYVLLECYAHRVHPFFPAVSPAEAQHAWDQVSSSVPLPSVLDAESVALVYAIMSCASQAAMSGWGPNENLDANASSSQYDAQARLWMSFFAKPTTGSTRQLHGLQAMTLLAYAAAARGEADKARRDLDEVHSLAATFAQRKREDSAPNANVVLRLVPVLQMLVDGLQSRIGPVRHLAPGERSALGSSTADLAAELCELASLCSTTGSVGRTMVELISLPPRGTVGKQRVEAEENRLESWYHRLPLSFRSSPGVQSEPISAGASCIAFVSLQHERLRLRLALHTFDEAGGDKDATRCMQLAMHTLRASDTVLRFLPPSPWLALHLQCFVMAAAFVLHRSLHEPSSASTRIVAEVEGAMASIRRLDHVVEGARELIDDLDLLCSRVRAALLQPTPDEDRKRSAYGQPVEDSTAKRIRTASTSQSNQTDPTTEAVQPGIPNASSVHDLDSSSTSWPTDAMVQVGALTLTELWPAANMPALNVAQQAPAASAPNDGVGGCSAQAQADLMAGLLEGLIGHHPQLRPGSL